MKNLGHNVFTLLALLALSGCVSIKIDEQTAFEPPKREVGPATTVAELDARMISDRFKSGVDEGIWHLDPVANGGTQVSFRSDGPSGRAGNSLPPSAVYRNGFIGSGAARIAWTMYTKVGTDNKELGSDRPLIVHCAGNAGDRYQSGPDYAANLLTWADVLVFDYPGYGDTPGPASAASFEAASRALTEHVVGLSQNRKLVFWGHSLGGFVCSRLASTTPGTDGLVLETTAPNAAAVARAWTPSYARLLVRAKVAPSLASYDVVSDSSQIRAPILVLGATKDGVLPEALARQVADGLKLRNANVTYHEFPNAKHQSVPYQAGFKDVVANFFQTVESQP